MNPSVKHPRGFILAEAIILVLVVAALAAILAVMATRPRRDARVGGDLANLRQLNIAHTAYAADNEDRFGTFSAGGGTGFQAAQEAWSILRERSGRPDWFAATAVSFMPYPQYSHLVLAEYLDDRLPSPAHISPADRARQLWQTDPFEGFEALTETQRPYPITEVSRRWPFSSSYELATAFWSADFAPTAVQEIGTNHNSWFIPAGAVLGGRRFAQVAFPAQKVHMFEQYERHFAPRELYFGYSSTYPTPGAAPGARVPLVFVDGAAAIRSTSDANRGFAPNSPTAPTRINYRPQPWEPPTLSGNEFDLVITHYRSTRCGLGGRDFGGPEVPLP